MENKKRNKVLDFLQGNMVPILFTVLCLASIKISGQNAGYVITETVSRVGRNAILIVSLILPVLCGMGLNFSIVLGAMAGEIGLILITHWRRFKRNHTGGHHCNGPVHCPWNTDRNPF